MDSPRTLSPQQLVEWFPHQLVSIAAPEDVVPAADQLKQQDPAPGKDQGLSTQVSPLEPLNQGLDAPLTQVLPFLGQNSKKILVLVNEKGYAHTADQHLDFLVTVLQACRLGLADIALVNVADKTLNWSQLLKQFQPRVTLAFQVDTPALGLPFVVPQYKVYAHGPLRFLPLPPLADYLVPDAEKAKGEKKLLWTALKTLFNI
jgi:hypothetical protein